MEYSRFKVFGERNSGTKYLEQLVLANSDLRSIKYRPNKLGISLLKNIKYDIVFDRLLWLDQRSSLGWKHGTIDRSLLKEQSDYFILCIVKNPYSFLLSLYEKPYHYKGELPNNILEFITKPWILRRRDGLKTKMLESPIELWNLKNRSYLNHSRISRNSILLRYEDLLKDSNSVLLNIWKKFDVKSFHKHSEVLHSTVDSVKKNEDYKQYYLDEKWKQKLDKQSIQLINERLNTELVRELGYTVL